MAELFGCTADNISLHLKNIYQERELGPVATAEKFSVVQKEVISNSSPDEVQKCLRALLKEGLPDAYELARSVVNKVIEKYDLFLTDELLSADYAASKLDAEGAYNLLKTLTQKPIGTLSSWKKNFLNNCIRV